MPREHKKRGRRAEEKKRKRELSGDGLCNVKRKRTVNGSPLTKKDGEKEHDYGSASLDERPHQHGYRPGFRYDYDRWEREGDEYANTAQATDMSLPFYGLLDSNEQLYFREAYNTLKGNSFPNDEERQLFVDNVYKEAEGKELKLACSQSCSRMLEGLILASSPEQIKRIYGIFKGQFSYLVQHLFASHCCDKLFLTSAAIVHDEAQTGKPGGGVVKVHLEHEVGLTKPADETSQEETSSSMESLILSVFDELWPHLGEYLTHMSASHCLRVLLTILAGEPLPNRKTAFKNSKRGSQKTEDTEIGQLSSTAQQVIHVPPSFEIALEKLIESVASMDTTYLRDLAMHEIGSPCLQLLLRLELSRLGKQRAKDENSIIRKLLPDDPISEESPSGLFIRALMSNPIGSFLLEEVLQLCPGKMFKGIYRDFFKNRLHILLKNEMSGYAVLKVLERLGKDDLDEVVRLIIPEIPQLVNRGRILIIRTLIERCVYRGVDTTPLALHLQTAYSGPNGFELTRLLKFGHGDRVPGNKKKAVSSEDTGSGKPKGRESTMGTTSLPYSSPMTPSQKLHASQLARTMISIPGILSEMIFGSLIRMGAAIALTMARDSAASQVLQAALVSPNASVIFRRKMIQQFYGHVGELALDPSGSHVIDAVWHGTQGLAFIRERIAEELAENEAALRQSVAGRAVWRNWRMVLYRKRRSDWVKMSRDTAGNQRFTSFPDGSGRLAESGARRKDNRDAGGGSSCSGSSAKEKEASRKAFIQSLLNERGEGRSSIQLARVRHAADRAASGGTHQHTPTVSSAAHAC